MGVSGDDRTEKKKKNSDRTNRKGQGGLGVKTPTQIFKIFGNFSLRYHPYTLHHLAPAALIYHPKHPLPS
jgi:hypothetical protein